MSHGHVSKCRPCHGGGTFTRIGIETHLTMEEGLTTPIRLTKFTYRDEVCPECAGSGQKPEKLSVAA